MKKYFALAMVALFAVVGCEKKPVPDNPDVKDAITVTPPTYSATKDGGSFPVTVEASGEYTATPDVAWITISGTTITVAENTEYEARTGNVNFVCGEASAKVLVSQEAAPKPKTYTELEGPANSFVVSEGGDYKINATVMGNGDAGLDATFPVSSTALSPAGAKLVWQEVDGLVSDVNFADGYIQFTAANRDGNAVVAATDAEGNIIWSWHIWCCEGFNDVACGDFTLMDRNLGAFMNSGEESNGLYYQWGRKDPFSYVLAFDPAAGEGWYHWIAGNNEAVSDPDIHSIAYTVAHPDQYMATSSRNNDWLLEADQHWLWGLDFSEMSLAHYPKFKSIYDPCPKGYCVASAACIGTGLSTGKLNDDKSVSLFDGAITIPAAGFIYMGGGGWYGYDSFASVWSCSTSWGNLENAFRLKSADDAYDNYDRATSAPVRCMKLAE